MEKTTQNSNKIEESLTLDNRKSIKLSGIIEVTNSSENTICAKLKETTVTIIGTNIHITKLDINCGILEANGEFNSIKYGKSANIFRKIFK
jgi:sporulation protein YabP